MTQQTATRRKVLTLRFSTEDYAAIIAHLTAFDEPGEKPPTREAVERWARSIVLDWVASAEQETE